jgi:hypothetical protein
MKNLRSLLLALLLSLALAACGAGTTGDDPNVDSPAAGDETPGTGDVLGDSENDGLDPLATPGTGDGGATDLTPEPGATTTTP